MADTTPKPKGKTGPQAMVRGGHARPPAEANLPKVLRIGVLQNGKVVEERIIRSRDTVSVGQNEKNTFVISSSEIPARFDLFEMKVGQYSLNFLENMNGRVSVKDEVLELSALKTSKEVRQKGKIFQLPLTDQSRGKVVLGESTLLFQFVAPPPVQPRPQLPAAVRGGMLRDMDWFMASVFAVSFFLHVGTLIFASTRDYPVESKWEQEYLKLEQLIAPKVEQKKEEKADEGKTEENKQDDEAKAAKKPKSNAPKEPQKSAEDLARERAERRAKLAEQLAQSGINKILGTMGDGSIADVLRGGDVAADQDALLSQVNGVGVASGDQAGLLRNAAGGKDSGEAADIDQLKMKGGDANVRTEGAGEERKIKGNIRQKNPAAIGGEGALDSKLVAQEVNRRIGVLKGCYERALRRDPTLSGKIIIQFTISGSGKVSSAKATTNELTPEVGSCITSAFMGFRFPPPEGGSLTFEYPFMFTPAN